MTRPLLVLLVLLAAWSAAWGRDYEVRVVRVEVNGRTVGASPLLIHNAHALCPVRMAELLEFEVEWQPGDKQATLRRGSQNALFTVGDPLCHVTSRQGQKRDVLMPQPPVILKTEGDRMWIPLDTAVVLAGGRMQLSGRHLSLMLHH
ncbi:MAG: stalk domain-containing protein [Candidatus Xenobia bacterium]